MKQYTLIFLIGNFYMLLFLILKIYKSFIFTIRADIFTWIYGTSLGGTGTGTDVSVDDDIIYLHSSKFQYI